MVCATASWAFLCGASVGSAASAGPRATLGNNIQLDLHLGAPSSAVVAAASRQLVRHEQLDPDGEHPHSAPQMVVSHPWEQGATSSQFESALIAQSSDPHRARTSQPSSSVRHSHPHSQESDGASTNERRTHPPSQHAAQTFGKSGRPDVHEVGAVQDVPKMKPADSYAERITLEAESQACLANEPVWECYQKYGSYGLKYLVTEEWDDILKLDYQRPDWMAHTKVQNRVLFDLTLPGTHGSGSYKISGKKPDKGPSFGIQSQHLNITCQLLLGVRAFDLEIVDTYPANVLWVASNGHLTEKLSTVLSQITEFVDDHKDEVIIIKARQGHANGQFDRITADTVDPYRVAGETVHKQFFAHLGRRLVLYSTLHGLPMGESMQNPTVRSLVKLNARIVYFWEGKQVLCTNAMTCSQTPARGIGLDPACIVESWPSTSSALPVTAVKKIRIWASDLRGAAFSLANSAKASDKKYKSACLEKARRYVPQIHFPNLFYWAEGQVLLTEKENAYVRDLIGNSSKVAGRGEAFTTRTVAERTNLLLLLFFMKKQQRELFTMPNVISHDFVSPVLVHRLIEAMQEKEDCGWSVYCKTTGSCWGMSRMRHSKVAEEVKHLCMSEEEAMALLEMHALGLTPGWVMFTVVFVTLFMGAFCVLSFALCRRFNPEMRNKIIRSQGASQQHKPPPQQEIYEADQPVYSDRAHARRDEGEMHL